MALDPIISRGYQGQIGNALQDARREQRTNTLLDLRAQGMQNELDDDAEWDQAYANRDINTMMRIDPRAAQPIAEMWQAEKMSGLEDIPLRQKIDVVPLQRQEMDERKFLLEQQKERNDQSYRNASLGIQRAQEARLSGDASPSPQASAPQMTPAPVELPSRALSLVDEANQAIAATSESEAIVDRAIATVKSGKVQLGALRNIESRGKNYAGLSDANSLAYADLIQTFEKIRNNYLLLAKGVQTEGDAQRAWNSEIGENVEKDNKLALQQLQKAKAMLSRAKAAQQTRIRTVYGNYGGAPPSESQDDNDPLGLFK
jgi:hypothetical protein